ncbi:hypothetical protein ACOSP7_007553 [Xanthoceras sorbifolium]
MTTQNQTNAEFRNEVQEILGRHESSIDEYPETTQTESMPEISFHAIVGTEHLQTLRLQGRLKGRTVTVLVDGRSTHNFVDQSLVTKYGLPMIHDKTFQVMVANREKIDCTGRFLGAQWLATLGPIEMNYQRLTMTFQDKRTSHTFQGIKQSGLKTSILYPLLMGCSTNYMASGTFRN